MSTPSRRRSLALLFVVEVAIGALIWFGTGSRSEAQPGSPPAAPAAPTAPIAPAEPVLTPPPPTAPGAIAPAAVAAVPDATPGKCPAKKPRGPGKPLLDDLIPIGILVGFIAFVLWRLPKVDLGHSPAFKRRRTLNWLPLGLTYTFLYFARYNLKAYQGIGLTEAEFATVFGVGSMSYGLSLIVNGPLTDRLGGRATILISAVGASAANLWMGYMAATGDHFGMGPVRAFTVAYAVNMYFQSFGAISIVKVNAAWFHLRERGTFGGIFGILISLGLYFAYDVGPRITRSLDVEWLFFIPAGLLLLFFVLSSIWVRNQPSDTGFPNFDLGDATNEGEKLTAAGVFWKLISNPVLITIALIEMCSGFLRQAILQWGTDFGKGIGLGNTFVFQNWGLVSCIAGITGGMFAGAISDHVFQSRRSPVAAVLYAIMLVGAISIVPLFSAPWAIGWSVAVMSMAIIGVHGMLTATASADFAGKKNTGMAVGLIDGFVYVGSMIQSFIYGAYLPAAKIRDASGCLVPNPDAKVIDNWHVWPYAMIPVAVIGFLLTLRIWNAKPVHGGRAK
ncbi:MAG: MFS transporter [Myxococcales bacterium]|nr:MFS transporter [Myxococcales bacterium]